MSDESSRSGPIPPESALPARPQTAPARRGRLWLVLAGAALLVGGVVVASQWSALSGPPRPQSLDGKLVVTVRPPEQFAEAVSADDAGALPVRAGGIMSLQVQLNQPAYAYLVWIDSAGQVVPLYPWNHETLEVRDVDRPPPARRAADVVYSPPIGGGWKFGEAGGLETVLLLVRRTPLEEGTRLGPIVGAHPPTKLRHREEYALLGLDRGGDGIAVLAAKNRGTDDEARAIDEPLRAAMTRLGEHFELIRAVRFAHSEEPKVGKK